jgi:hypothetical protein
MLQISGLGLTFLNGKGKIGGGASQKLLTI